MHVTGKQVRAARALLGLSQTDLANLAGTNRRTIWQFENENVKPHRSTRSVIELALCELVDFSDDGVRLR